METSENQMTKVYKQCLNERLMGNNSFEMHIVQLQHVMEFIQKNITNIGNNVQMIEILPILEYSLRAEYENGHTTMQLGDFILNLLEMYKADELSDICLDNSLQLLYQMLQTLQPAANKRLVIGEKAFEKLQQILFMENTKPHIIANILACLQLYVGKFEAPNILATLWHEIERNLAAEQDTFIQVLITLFDDFANCKVIDNFKETMQTTSLMENLLQTEMHDKRKCAYFLLKKTYPFLAGTPHFWLTCISILENLEENQSHLILPTLELLKNLKPTSGQELSWLQILHRRILLHNNILVRRWVLEYFLEYHKFCELPTENALQFMRALNETNLYNIEGYMLPDLHISKFLAKSEEKFLKIFSHLNWKAVPLHFWFSQSLKTSKEGSFNVLSLLEGQENVDELLLNLAAKIRALQNITLRRKIIELFHQLFADYLANMYLLTYVELIKSLYNVSDPFNNFELLSKKFEQFPASTVKANGNSIFNQRFYEIFTNTFMLQGHHKFSKSFENIIYQKLEGIDCACQGYLSLLAILFFEESLEKQTFCQCNYGLDILKPKQMKSFNDLYGLLSEKLCQAVENKIFLKQRAIDFYVCSTNNFKTFNDFQNCDMKFDKLLNAGSIATLLRITTFLAAYQEKVEANVLETLINCLSEHLKNINFSNEIISNLLKYMKAVLNSKDCAFWIKKLLQLDLENLRLAENILLNCDVEVNDEEFLLQGALNGDAKSGDLRIEEAYINKFNMKSVNGHRLRSAYVYQITTKESMALKQTILLKICNMAKDLNVKKPRYFAHSREHRKLTRMTNLVWNLRTTAMKCETVDQLFEKFWCLLMNHNNQPNVTIIYECLIAAVVNFKKLFGKIMEFKKNTKCTSSQEVSIIILIFRYFEANWKSTSLQEFNEVIGFLWPLTMGSSFQTRLYAQLVVVVLIEKLEELNVKNSHTTEIQAFIKLKIAIEEMIGRTQINEFLNDFRFTPINTTNFYDEIMYLAQMPYDEYEKSQQHYDNEYKLPTKKLLETAKGDGLAMERIINDCKGMDCSNISSTATDVQRKLNPTADFMPQSNLISYPANKDSELYVIASFIDKIPNLGGIARTCEVLGIRNLVMASKADIKKADFKNLSMTAEKTLNIIEVKPLHLKEFLIQKKSEGFEIVGAEQTAKSCNFIDFKFPKRCLLMLGHEKEGIPPNFLSFLDYAVEIPQFGMVRSLNVHVTGALFMWEYCKQHICKKINK